MPTATARNIIYQALRLTGVLRPGQTANTDMEGDCFIQLNNMIDSWNAQRWLIYVIVRGEFALVNAQVSYTMGVGGNFAVARSPKIDYAGYVLNAGTEQENEQRIPVLTVQQWSQVGNKLMTGQFPQAIYPDGGFPFNTIYVWPVMSSVPATTKLVLYYWQVLAEFAVLQPTSYSFPPAYMEAIVKNLACLIYPQVMLNNKLGSLAQYQMLEKQAAHALGVVKSINAPMIQMTCDPSLNNEGGAGYNIFSDTFGNRSY